MISSERLGDIRRRDDFESIKTIRREKGEDARVPEKLRGYSHEVICIEPKYPSDAFQCSCLVGGKQCDFVEEINLTNGIQYPRRRDNEMDRLALNLESKKVLAIFVPMLHSSGHGVRGQSARIR